MPKVVYTSAKGLVQQAGEGVQLEDLPYTTLQVKTAAFTVGQPGVYTLTAGGAAGATMPLASAFPGGIFTVRNGDANANFLTGSLETAGTKVFSSVFSSNNSGQGSKITLAAATGASVTVMSDGKNYLVLAASGSLTFSGI